MGMESSHLHITENTISGKRSVLLNRYSEMSNEAADVFLKNTLTNDIRVALTDMFNMIVFRGDNTEHSWKKTKEADDTFTFMDLPAETLIV